MLEKEGPGQRGWAGPGRAPPLSVSSTPPPCPQDFIQELLGKLRGLHKQSGLPQPSLSGDGSLSPPQDRAWTAPP